MYRMPHACCICGEKLTISRLSCPHCQTSMEGSFQGCRFCALSPEEELFLLTFIKNRGSIKDVERELGISYPTVRAALDNLIASLGLDGEPTATEEPSREDTPKARRKADPDTARARKNILKKLSEHRITADEAAQLLRELS